MTQLKQKKKKATAILSRLKHCVVYSVRAAFLSSAPEGHLQSVKIPDAV